MIRYILVGKFLRREVTQVLHPRAVLPIRLHHREVPEPIMRAVFTLVALYLAGYVVIALIVIPFLKNREDTAAPTAIEPVLAVRN